MGKDTVQLSKFLSLVLRHQPESIGLTLDAQGWANVDALIAHSHAASTVFSRDELLQLVASSDKQRFSLSPDGQRIRAAQGHSVPVSLNLQPLQPPAVLYHGTATRFLDAIRAQGLTPQARQQVHLSADVATASRVGQRHGKLVVLQVDALRMHGDGLAFVQADNGVWLTDAVPAQYLVFDAG